MTDLLPGVPVPLMYGFAVLCFGGWVGLAYMVRLLFTGGMGSGRELREKTARIETLEAALRTRDEQVDAALRALPQLADVLKKFHVAAQLVREEDA